MMPNDLRGHVMATATDAALAPDLRTSRTAPSRSRVGLAHRRRPDVHAGRPERRGPRALGSLAAAAAVIVIVAGRST